MRNKNIVITAILIIVSILLLLFAISSFYNTKKVELDFNKQKATLVKESLDLKDRLDTIQETITQKTEALIVATKEKAELEEQSEALKRAATSFRVTSNKELEKLKRKTHAFSKKIFAMENAPIVQRIRDAVEKKGNENIKKILEYSVDKINLVKEGKIVDLEPIVVTKEPSGQPSAKEKRPTPQREEGLSGIVLSVDRNNNLIVINLGHDDGVKEGYKCKIFQDGQVVGSAEIMSVRYKVSAAFVDDLPFKASMADIKEGCKVIIPENQ